MPPRRPNILIFMNDQEQFQVTQPDHPCRTPHADRLAAEGLRFTRCYTPTAHCCPARATFQTGLNPSGHGVYNNILNHAALHTDLYAGVPTIGDLLRDAGYDLKWSGKWHVTKHRDPEDCGWEQLLGTSLGGLEHHGRKWEDWHQVGPGGDGTGERRPGELLRPGWGSYRHYGTMPPRPGQDHDFTPGDYRIVTEGLRGLDQALAGDGPWCVYIGPNGPHDPYIIPEKYATMYDPASVPMPASWDDDCADKPAVYQRQRQFWNQLSPAEQRAAVAHYWGYCTMQDDLLGMVLERLDASDQAADTLVLFISDHGDYNGAHGLWMKGIPAFDEAYHVPCLMRWPNGGATPGTVVDEFVTLADFCPTFVELAGLPPRDRCHGRSLTPFLTGEPAVAWPQQFVSQMNGVELYYSQRIVQTRRWKYVFNGFDWDELYDLQADPGETRNLAPRPGEPHPEREGVVRELCQLLWREAERTNDVVGNPYPTVALAPFGPLVGLAE
ncbi:MAG: sulfatase-like hydrolase/transferase [Fimbriimonadaceae bacterium]|nr:sulfatase-like hydrolase/transferase [Fimbriimonadaceae bacterium]